MRLRWAWVVASLLAAAAIADAEVVRHRDLWNGRESCGGVAHPAPYPDSDPCELVLADADVAGLERMAGGVVLGAAAAGFGMGDAVRRRSRRRARSSRQ